MKEMAETTSRDQQARGGAGRRPGKANMAATVLMRLTACWQLLT